ncbi:MAG TPA: hypothetical protein PLI65_06280 [Bacteroidales bacterium]|nr:hypothetical protein [Bacteroidales bacterium]HRW96464.1 hypothetical protein [Bacteroidales bacterium]
MIRHLKHAEIDAERWDRCISQSVNGMIYAYSWYLDLVNNGWEALVENDYERVMPLTHGRKLGIHYLFQPPFTQQLGIFSKNRLNHEVVDEFIEAIPPCFKFIEINLNTHNKVNPLYPGYSPWLTHELDLISPYENLRSNYSTNTVRNIKKAVNAKISVVENIKPEGIIDIFIKNKAEVLPGLKQDHFNLLRRLIYVMIYKRSAQTIGAFDETNNLCAGAFFVFSKTKAIFYFSATDQKAKSTGAMPFLIDYFIHKHAHSHVTLDFEGSNDPNLARFYKSFGASEITYPHLCINKLNPLVNFGAQLVKKLRF